MSVSSRLPGCWDVPILSVVDEIDRVRHIGLHRTFTSAEQCVQGGKLRDDRYNLYALVVSIDETYQLVVIDLFGGYRCVGSHLARRCLSLKGGYHLELVDGDRFNVLSEYMCKHLCRQPDTRAD